MEVEVDRKLRWPNGYRGPSWSLKALQLLELYEVAKALVDELKRRIRKAQ